ncbi:hypothetical protein GBA52_016710 [Prunus armeniaca]|nr:hypothetical protein GBA52_016710 [Prunus armeniaca]
MDQGSKKPHHKPKLQSLAYEEMKKEKEREEGLRGKRDEEEVREKEGRWGVREEGQRTPPPLVRLKSVGG